MAIADRLFCASATARYGPYQRQDDGQELLPDLLYRFRVADSGHASYALQLFCGLGDLGGRLWEHEARVMLRTSALEHPALPVIREAGYDESSDVAFVVSPAAQYTLQDPAAMPFMREHPDEALRHLGLLADALAVLHGQGLTHRFVCPNAIDVLPTASDDRLQLRIARFEMSSFITNVLRRFTVRDEAGPDDEERRRLLSLQDENALPYCPPERLLFLDEDRRDAVETDRSDIYGLGVMAWEWFVGPIPEQARSRFRTDRPSSAAAQLGTVLRDGLTQSGLALRLRRLLESMLEPDPRSRPTSAQVVGEITKGFDAMSASWRGEEVTTNYLLAFMPEECRHTLGEWGWYEQDETSEMGRRELKALHEADMRGARVLLSPNGAEDFVAHGDVGKRRRARTVILGHRAAWFCEAYRQRSPFGGGPGRPIAEVQIVKFVVPREAAGKLDSMPLQRQIPGVDAFPWDADLVALAAGRPSWDPLLKSVSFEQPRPPWLSTYEGACEWLLDYLEVELSARDYPFTTEHTRGEPIARLHFDRSEDQRRLHRSALFTFLASQPGWRPAFGDFFEGAETDEGSPMPLQFRPDNRKQPPSGAPNVGLVWMSRRLDADAIEVRCPRECAQLPAKGWLRPFEDHGSWTTLRRQRDVLPEFLGARGLLTQLHSPCAVVGFRHRWREAGRGLRGEAPGVIKDMLASQAFYALHGPPGTGKTTVLAHAVEAYLRAEPGSRVLVTAQSHYALDNLACCILDRLKAAGLDAIPLRVASESAREKIHDRIEGHCLEKLVPRAVQSIKRRVKDRLEEGCDDRPIRQVLGGWLGAVEYSQLELHDRLMLT